MIAFDESLMPLSAQSSTDSTMKPLEHMFDGNQLDVVQNSVTDSDH